FIVTCIFRRAEVLANRVLVGFEELLAKALIDHGDGSGVGRVLDRDPAAGKNVRAYRVKVLGVDFGHGRGQVSDGLALDLDAGAAVIVFHGRVAGDANSLDTGKLMEAGFDGAIESFYLPLAVPGGLRTDVDDVAVFRFEFEIGVLELAQAFREQSRAQ